jgi:hypothetical protein
MVNKFDLNKLDKLFARTSKGPWGVWKGHASVHNNITKNTPHELRQAKGSRDVAECDEGYDDKPDKQARGNAQFIAAVKNAYPEMATEIRNLRAEVARLQFTHCELEAAAGEGEGNVS